VTELKLPYLSMPAERSDVTGRMLMHVALNGHPINAVLDTGSTQTIVTREAALKSGAAATQLESGKAMPNTDANGIGPSTHQVSFATVDIGRERFHNIKMNVANARFGEVDALVGLDYLRRRVVRLSAARGRIYILQPSHVIPPLRMSQTAAQ
jgi:predicted aspartyl protease